MTKLAETIKQKEGTFSQFDGVIYELIEAGLFEAESGNFGQMVELEETIGADIARNLADALQADNPRFDSARFLTACGVK